MKINNENVKEYFNKMRRCTKCILPETFPGIKYDDKGECNYCKIYEPMYILGEEEFIKLLSKYRGKGKKYDIAVPISGGRDSSFVLHQIVNKYNIRAMGITVDSGFMTEEANRNLEVIVKKLNVPYVILKNDKKIEIAKKNTKIKFRGWIENPSINTILPVLNAGDKTMNLQMYRYAKDHGIPLVLGGNIIGNASIEQDHWKTGYMGIFPDERGVYTTSDKLKLIILYGLEFIKNPYNYHPSILNEYFWGTITYFFDAVRRPKGINSTGFYYYIYWDEKTILNTIIKDLDWKGADDTITTWRIDDSAYPMVNYLLYNLVGFTEHDEMYSKMIREGQLTREKALERIKDDHKPRLKKLAIDFKEFDITKEELDNAIKPYRKKLLKKILKSHHKGLEIL